MSNELVGPKTIVCPERGSNQLLRGDSVPDVTIADLMKEDSTVARYLSAVLGYPPAVFTGRQMPGMDRRFWQMLARLSTQTNLAPEENAIMTTARIVVLRRNASRQREMPG